MQRYFIEPKAIQNGILRLADGAFHHAKHVMRMEVGDEVTICDNRGLVALCQVITIGKNTMELKVVSEERVAALKTRFVVAQALIKKDAFETMLQKATELGVDEIIPVAFSRSLIKLDEKEEIKKKERYETIVQEAAEQSERAFLPIIHPVSKLADIDVSGYALILVAHARTDQRLSLIQAVAGFDFTKPILIVIGPEGGITDAELALLESRGGIMVSFGNRILRSETASLYALSVIHALAEANQ